MVIVAMVRAPGHTIAQTLLTATATVAQAVSVDHALTAVLPPVHILLLTVEVAMAEAVAASAVVPAVVVAVAVAVAVPVADTSEVVVNRIV